jgi:hypothetical protein
MNKTLHTGSDLTENQVQENYEYFPRIILDYNWQLPPLLEKRIIIMLISEDIFITYLM